MSKPKAKKKAAHNPIYDDEPQASELSKLGARALKMAQEDDEKAAQQAAGPSAGHATHEFAPAPPLDGRYCTKCGINERIQPPPQCFGDVERLQAKPSAGAGMSDARLEELRMAIGTQRTLLANRALDAVAEIDRLRAENDLIKARFDANLDQLAEWRDKVAAKDAEIARINKMERDRWEKAAKTFGLRCRNCDGTGKVAFDIAGKGGIDCPMCCGRGKP